MALTQVPTSITWRVTHFNPPDPDGESEFLLALCESWIKAASTDRLITLSWKWALTRVTSLVTVAAELIRPFVPVMRWGVNFVRETFKVSLILMQLQTTITQTSESGCFSVKKVQQSTIKLSLKAPSGICALLGDLWLWQINSLQGLFHRNKVKPV